MRKILTIAALTLLTNFLHAQPTTIFTSDIDNFWVAYDSVRLQNDPAKQIAIIQTQYLDKASIGLREMIKLKEWTSADFQKNMITNANFWKSIRVKTEGIKDQNTAIEKLYSNYQRIYKNFKAPEIYFLMGYIQTGGTTTQNQLLIGTEIAAADATVDTRGLHPMIRDFMSTNTGILGIIAHELTHTQQRGGDMETDRKSNLLGFCLAEGSCDFIAEMITGTEVKRPYMKYGKQHERELWEKFKIEMHGRKSSDWLYNGFQRKNGDSDLGYYIGYAICKSYYENASDKDQAISEIISLDLDSVQALDVFLEKSRYNP
ncbi:hypothetical protein DSL64_03010 [Dyadobacter luteus]|uniref:DUF2268 domain-containing protein n=1 Tax=Dyadobacter luteus TaxID=2259619 RepID=A0A3D8YFL4_9BACT|nr:DUF2268 domain-containing putative Zn-dependent protease [Dyadobacter luteus]REA63433.1 hypothetical protein DSL64_03010 [Dyadobacter luteus]